MPTRPRSFCLNNCKRYAIRDRRYCEQCANAVDKKREESRQRYRKQYDKKRGSSYARGYGSDWQRLSKYVRANEPMCRLCKMNLADCVDHIIPLSKGGERMDMDNLQPLCNKCHAAKTRLDVMH